MLSNGKEQALIVGMLNVTTFFSESRHRTLDVTCLIDIEHLHFSACLIPCHGGLSQCIFSWLYGTNDWILQDLSTSTVADQNLMIIAFFHQT